MFYTDGLIERPHTGLDAGTAELVAVLTGQQGRTAEQVCDQLLRHFGPTAEDDIVLAVIQAHPEDRPRPVEAGPEILPRDFAPDY